MYMYMCIICIIYIYIYTSYLFKLNRGFQAINQPSKCIKVPGRRSFTGGSSKQCKFKFDSARWVGSLIGLAEIRTTQTSPWWIPARERVLGGALEVRILCTQDFLGVEDLELLVGGL